MHIGGPALPCSGSKRRNIQGVDLVRDLRQLLVRAQRADDEIKFYNRCDRRGAGANLRLWATRGLPDIRLSMVLAELLRARSLRRECCIDP